MLRINYGYNLRGIIFGSSVYWSNSIAKISKKLSD